MQRFKSLFFKELSSYFNNLSVYIIILTYGIVSVGAALYFGAYLAAKDNALYSLFYLLPIIVTALIPALTMKTWSEEYKSGTAEFLLTQPMPFYVPVGVKFLAAALIMCLTVLAVSGAFVLYTSAWLQLDMGQVLCSFCGIGLFILLFTALGCFISCFNRNIISSYLVSVFIMAIWLALPVTRLYETYQNFLFAQVGLADVAYFIFFTVAFLASNILVLAYNRFSIRFKRLKLAAISFLWLTSAGILTLLCALLFDYKADFSSAGIYTLQPQSKRLAAELQKPLTLDVYVAKDYKYKNPAHYRHVMQTQRLLQRYKDAANGMINLQVTEVKPFSEEETAIINSGMYFEPNAAGTKDYFGALLRDEEKHGVLIKQFLPERRPFFEKDIDKSLLKLTNSQVIKNIGVYMDPIQDLDEFEGFLLNLEDDYKVLPISPETYEISPELNMLILLNPKTLPNYFLYAIDQYLMHGGKLLVFFDFLTENQNYDINMEDIDIIEMFDNWGIVLQGDIISTGSPAAQFAGFRDDMVLLENVTFDVAKDGLKVTEFINSNGHYAGAWLQGKFASAFTKNPFINFNFGRKMPSHLLYSAGNADIALVADVDLLLERNWLAPQSPDRNPYSAIYNSANLESVRRLIDAMLDNQIYNDLPTPHKIQNLFSIGEQISNNLTTAYAPMYEQIEAEKNKISEETPQNTDGQEYSYPTAQQERLLEDLQQKTEHLNYDIRQEYSRQIAWLIFVNMLICPLAGCLLAALLWFGYKRLKYRNLKEKTDA